MIDGAMAGGSAGHDRDGYDLFSFMVARKAIIEAVDVELFESRYPALVTEKRPRPGEAGAGRHRAGAGCQMSYRPYGVEQIEGVMLGMREWLPLPGIAGGMPGANTEFAIYRSDGRRDVVPGHASGVIVREGEQFEFRIGSGGGVGDPLDREPAEVARDVRHGRITAEEARATYGVMLAADQEDSAATLSVGRKFWRSRLARSIPPRKPATDAAFWRRRSQGQPLYPGRRPGGGDCLRRGERRRARLSPGPVDGRLSDAGGAARKPLAHSLLSGSGHRQAAAGRCTAARRELHHRVATAALAGGRGGVVTAARISVERRSRESAALLARQQQASGERAAARGGDADFRSFNLPLACFAPELPARLPQEAEPVQPSGG